MDNNNNNYAIKIEGVKKQYRLGQIGGGTLTADLQSWWARVRGKDDPNLRLDQDQRLIGQSFMALNGIDLEIKQGEAVGIIGSNGAGKSTLLKLLSRVTAPTAGTIDINGRIASMLEVGTGFHGEMTGRENVYLNGAILGMTKAEIDAKMDEIIEFSEIGDFIDTPVKRYSSGMYVKLAFSVAAHLDSEIMIMDEVLAVGDMAFQKKCLDKMRDAAEKQGRTVLYVSHNMNTIRQLCKRCIVLDKGKVVFEGDVEEAIAIYMGTTDWSDLPVFYDYRNQVRKYSFGKIAFLNSLELYNKKSAIFDFKEDIKLKISISTKQFLEGVQIIARIKDTNNVQKIAACLSDPFNLYTEKDNMIIVTIPTDSLLHDNYCLTIELIKSVTTGGEYISYDNPMVPIPITIVPDFSEDFSWSKKYWGNVIIPSADVECVESGNNI